MGNGNARKKDNFRKISANQSAPAIALHLTTSGLTANTLSVTCTTDYESLVKILKYFSLVPTRIRLTPILEIKFKNFVFLKHLRIITMSIFHPTVSIFLVFFTNAVLCIMKYDNRSKSHIETKIVFPDSPDIPIQDIPLDIIRRLNEVTSMEEFLNIMVEPTEIMSTGISDRIGSDNVERSSLRTAKMAKCMPELQTVSLKAEKTSSTFYYPSCTRVKRCGGCCLHDLFACRPVEKEIIPLTVAVAEYRGGHQLRLKETKIIEVEEHIKCECGCKIQPEDCTKYQKYSAEKCRCECTNTDKERKCYKESHKKIWNPDDCSCICREELECGSGFDFDPFTCSCVPARGRKKPSFIYEID